MSQFKDLRKALFTESYPDILFDSDVKEGDKITLDINNYKIHLDVSDEELAKRRAEWKAPEPKVKDGYLARYAKLVSSADKGAILQ